MRDEGVLMRLQRCSIPYRTKIRCILHSFEISCQASRNRPLVFPMKGKSSLVMLQMKKPKRWLTFRQTTHFFIEHVFFTKPSA